MNNYLQQIKTLYNTMKVRKISYEKPGIRPSADWRLMLTCTVCVICILALFSIYFYVKINNGELFMAKKDDAKKDVEIDLTLLKKTISDIKIREDTANALNVNGSKPGDPSI